MFQIVSDPVFAWPATAYVPTPSGEVEAQPFTLRFRFVEDSEARTIERDEIEAGGDVATIQKAVLRHVIVGWADVAADPDGRPAEFSAATLDEALRLPWFRAAAFTAYNAAMAAGPKAKN